jgi:hypothetical protein
MWLPTVCILINANRERKPVSRLNAQFLTRLTCKRRGPPLLTALLKARKSRRMSGIWLSALSFEGGGPQRFKQGLGRRLWERNALLLNIRSNRIFSTWQQGDSEPCPSLTFYKRGTLQRPEEIR